MFFRFLKYDFSEKKSFYDRDKYDDVLQDPSSTLWHILSKFIIFCILVAVGLVILETVPSLSQQYGRVFFYGDAVISCIFLLEYIYRFFKSRTKLRFIWGFFNVIDLISFLPFFLSLFFPSLVWLGILKVLRLLRILRLFEVSVKSPIALGFIKTIREYSKEYKAIFTLFASLLIIFSSFVYLIEHTVNPGFKTIPDALWWGLVTMTTVWYGDIVPITIFWKILGACMILLWPILLAVISSITILVFMDVAESQKITSTKVCQTCKTRNTEHANFCLNCGNEHFTDINVVDESIRIWWKTGFISKIFSRK